MNEFVVCDHALIVRDHDKKICSHMKMEADSDQTDRKNASKRSQNPKKYTQKDLKMP